MARRVELQLHAVVEAVLDDARHLVEVGSEACLALHQQDPAAPTGAYNLDLDVDGAADDRNGDGAVNAADQLVCDMDRAGGGW